jgi:hypothetical protein
MLNKKLKNNWLAIMLATKITVTPEIASQLFFSFLFNMKNKRRISLKSTLDFVKINNHLKIKGSVIERCN